MTSRRTRLQVAAIIAVLAASAIAAATALAAPKLTPYSRYTLSGSSRVSGLTVNYRAYALLPSALPDRTANGGSTLRFGPIGTCKYELSISIRVVPRDGSESADARVARLLPAGDQYIYARGTRGAASWRVIRVKGSASVRGIYEMPASVATSVLFGSPTKPVWVEVRASANEPVTECHSGGPRFIGATLADGFGSMTSTAFSTGLPRPVGPPKP